MLPGPLNFTFSPLPLGDSVLGCGELPCLGVMHGGTPELRRRHRGIQREKGKEEKGKSKHAQKDLPF